MKPRALLATMVAVGSLLVAPRAALATPKLALDGEAAIALAPARVSSGGGAALRIGYELDAVVVSLTPEIGGSYHALSGDLSPSMFRAFGGARIAFGAVLRPGFYAHAGYGHIQYANQNRGSASFDGGVFLDLTVLPVVDIGVHAGYAIIAANDEGPANQWLAIGAHIAVAF